MHFWSHQSWPSYVRRCNEFLKAILNRLLVSSCFIIFRVHKIESQWDSISRKIILSPLRILASGTWKSWSFEWLSPKGNLFKNNDVISAWARVLSKSNDQSAFDSAINLIEQTIEQFGELNHIMGRRNGDLTNFRNNCKLTSLSSEESITNSNDRRMSGSCWKSVDPEHLSLYQLLVSETLLSIPRSVNTLSLISRANRLVHDNPTRFGRSCVRKFRDPWNVFSISIWLWEESLIRHETSGFLCIFVDISVSALFSAQYANLWGWGYRDSVVRWPRRLRHWPRSDNEKLRPAHFYLWHAMCICSLYM
jgi:hypothetical protein